MSTTENKVVHGVEVGKEYAVVYKTMTQTKEGSPRFWLVLHGISHAVEVTAFTYATTSWSTDTYNAPKIDLEWSGKGCFKKNGLW